MMEVRFVVYRSSQTLWEEIMQQAAEFASSLPTGSLINISHSVDHSDSVVAVWYWADIKSPQKQPRTVWC